MPCNTLWFHFYFIDVRCILNLPLYLFAGTMYEILFVISQMVNKKTTFNLNAAGTIWNILILRIEIPSVTSLKFIVFENAVLSIEFLVLFFQNGRQNKYIYFLNRWIWFVTVDLGKIYIKKRTETKQTNKNEIYN